MVYDAAIPQSTDLLSNSQGGVLENFTQLNSQFEIDHVALNAASNNGKHKKSTYIIQSVDPGTGADEVAVYSKDIGGPGNQRRLFIQQSSNEASDAFQFSGDTPVTGLNNSTFLPGGIMMKFGRAQIDAGESSVEIIFAGNNFNSITSITVSPQSGGPTTDMILSSDGIDVNKFICRSSGTQANDIFIFYVVLGV